MIEQPGFSIADELGSADFGDKRLTDRLTKVAGDIFLRPSESFPKISGSVAGLEATYRFLGNPKVTAEEILAPHIEATIRRASDQERVIVAHDTTEFVLPGQGRTEELGWVARGKQGFFGHFSLALSRTSFVRPLGVVGIETIFRTEKPRATRRNGRQSKLDPNRESLRWWNAVHRSENLFPSEVKPIHVMDREADDYELFSDLSAQQIRFVIRLRHNRLNCQVPGTEREAKLFELLEGLSSRRSAREGIRKIRVEMRMNRSSRNVPARTMASISRLVAQMSLNEE